MMKSPAEQKVGSGEPEAGPSVAVVIVIWNGKQDTLECLESLAADTYGNKRVILVDNGSTDGSAQEIRRSHPEVLIVETGANLGFTGGNNAGMREAVERDFDYLFLLNNDTTVEPEAIGKLVEAAEAHPEYGILAPVIHYHDAPEEIWFADSRLVLESGAAWHDNARKPGRTDAPYEIPWATGCALLIRTRLMKAMEGFDDRYYLSWEDVDLSLRVRRTGLAVAAAPAARIYHKGGRSGDRMPESKYYYAARNRLLLVWKHERGFRYWRAAFRIMKARLLDCWRICRRQPGEFIRYSRTTIGGMIDHLRGRYGAFETR